MASSSKKWWEVQCKSFIGLRDEVWLSEFCLDGVSRTPGVVFKIKQNLCWFEEEVSNGKGHCQGCDLR